MLGRCPSCDHPQVFSDYAEVLCCIICGDFFHPEHVKPFDIDQDKNLGLTRP